MVHLAARASVAIGILPPPFTGVFAIGIQRIDPDDGVRSVVYLGSGWKRRIEGEVWRIDLRYLHAA